MSTSSKGKKQVVGILMRRDGMSQSDAEALVEETLGMVSDSLECGDVNEAEEIWMSELGLEVDYLLNVIA